MTREQAAAELATIAPRTTALWIEKIKLQEQIEKIVDEWHPLYSRQRDLEVYIKVQEENSKLTNQERQTQCQ